MALQIIRDAPSRDSYTSLAEHQAQTPGTFFGGRPVLYYQAQGAKLSIDKQHLASDSSFASLAPAQTEATSEPVLNGNSDHADQEQVELSGLDVWVTSEYFILFSPSSSAGVRIPYPTISLHAQQSDALYMQLCLSDMSQTADDDLETVELLLTPGSVSAPAATEETPGASTSQTPIQELYAAVSACADLHPDPSSDDEGAEQEPMPGAGGWITSENMHEFFDEEGNLRAPNGVTMLGGEEDTPAEGSLGAGAGTIRTADEIEDADEGAVDGDETKWRRTD